VDVCFYWVGIGFGLDWIQVGMVSLNLKMGNSFCTNIGKYAFRQDLLQLVALPSLKRLLGLASPQQYILHGSI
jgi:hypothetical protein